MKTRQIPIVGSAGTQSESNACVVLEPAHASVSALLMPRLWAAALILLVSGAQAAAPFTSLHSFNGSDGYSPNGLAQGSDGYFYGTTINGGTNSNGTVFKISANGALTSLYSFTGGNDGANPQAGLMQGSDGNFYGTTYEGGQPSLGAPAGTIFKVTPNGALTNLYSFNVDFNGGNDGSYPSAGLIQGGDGYFYGTTLEGGIYAFANSGTNGYGTVFKMSTNGTLTRLYAFSGGNDGANPAAALALGSDGDFYGTTQAGGLSNAGTIFKINPNGATPDEILTSLYSFSGGDDGGGPQAGLVQGSDGYFYGTTYAGGTNNSGSVFKISTNGVLTSLYAFSGGDDGANPVSGLVRGSDGNFYGTTQSGGTNSGQGTIFKITATGAFTSLYSFSGGSDGANPQAGLVQGSDGSFFGTTINGGLGGDGTVFRLSVVLGPPQLTIEYSATNVVMTWPTNAIGYTLQSTSNLSSPASWTASSAAPTVVDGQNTVTNPISGTQQFYRLKR